MRKAMSAMPTALLEAYVNQLNSSKRLRWESKSLSA